MYPRINTHNTNINIVTAIRIYRFINHIYIYYLHFSIVTYIPTPLLIRFCFHISIITYHEALTHPFFFSKSFLPFFTIISYYPCYLLVVCGNSILSAFLTFQSYFFKLPFLFLGQIFLFDDYFFFEIIFN